VLQVTGRSFRFILEGLEELKVVVVAVVELSGLRRF
jgi:hypothetical protein